MRGIPVFVCAVSVFLFSCTKKEAPVTPAHRSGDVTIATVDMNSDYKYQVYFSLENNEVVSSNMKTDWDFAIDNDGDHILLNSSRALYAKTTSATQLASITDTIGISFNWDVPSKSADSTAIGKLQQALDVVIVIDMGFDSEGNHLGVHKMMINKNDSDFIIKHQDLQSSVILTSTLSLDQKSDYTYYSFNKGVVNIEPEKGKWQLHFTQYVHVFHAPTLPYLVTGVITNHNNTKVSKAMNKSFDTVDLDYAKDLVYSSSADVIGYDWKSYSFESGSFTIDHSKIYIIKTTNGEFYKLRFLDFYNTLGEKGNPLFEFQRL